MNFLKVDFSRWSCWKMFLRNLSEEGCLVFQLGLRGCWALLYILFPPFSPAVNRNLCKNWNLCRDSVRSCLEAQLPSTISSDPISTIIWAHLDYEGRRHATSHRYFMRLDLQFFHERKKKASSFFSVWSVAELEKMIFFYFTWFVKMYLNFLIFSIIQSFQ